MSLILEALRKSEAERHRGLPPRLDSPMLRPTRRRQRLAPGLALLVLGAPAAGWFIYRGMAPDFAESSADSSLAALLPPLPEGGPAPAIDVALASQDPTASTAQSTAPPVVQRAAPGAAPAVTAVALGSNGTALRGGSFSAAQDLPPPERMRPHTPSARAPAEASNAATPAAPQAPATAIKTAPAMPTPAPVVSAPPAAVAPLPTPAAPAPQPVAQPAARVDAQVASIAAPPPVIDRMPEPEPAVPIIYDLSYEIRRELPELDMSMHVYSSDAAARFIVLNGKRLQEGSTTAESEIQLVSIQRSGAVMAFRGTQFLLPRQGM